MNIEHRIQEQTAQLEAQWAEDERWAGIERTYTAEDVVRLRGSVVPECTLGRIGSERLWRLPHARWYTNALGALTGGQRADGQGRPGGDLPLRLAGRSRCEPLGSTYPDQSLYPRTRCRRWCGASTRPPPRRPDRLVGGP